VIFDHPWQQVAHELNSWLAQTGLEGRQINPILVTPEYSDWSAQGHARDLLYDHGRVLRIARCIDALDPMDPIFALIRKSAK
jgi:hypothetical protein